jgi:CRISPR/Cas system-associated protein Csm6
MARHLIVTCGTSQTDRKKLEEIEASCTPDAWKQLNQYLFGSTAGKRGGITGSPAGINDVCFREVTGVVKKKDGTLTNDGISAKTLAEGLKSRWGDIGKFIGNDRNPFGAEICTLFKTTHCHPAAFEPTSDTVTLLYSDTLPGAFCAGVLYLMLTDSGVFAMPLASVIGTRIPELYEEPRDVDLAEENTRSCVLEARKEDRENIYVISGGFKSIIPTLTTYALIYEEDIYYLFERSKDLRKLTPLAEVISPDKRRRWLFSRDREVGSNQVQVTIRVRTGTGPKPNPTDNPSI